MSVVLPFTANSVTTFSYEPFSFTISNPGPGLYTMTASRTSGIPASYITLSSNAVVFATSSNGMSIGTQQLSIVATSSTSTLNASISISTSPGRFLDSNGASFVGSNYTFFDKEAITPIKLNAPFNILAPTAVPSLPPGLSFSAVDGSSVFLRGTPLLTAPQSNYLIIGRSSTSSKTVSSTLSFVISNERVVTTVTPDSFVNGMIVGTPITPRVFTSKGNGVVRYRWGALPAGLDFTDIAGDVVSSAFIPSDPSLTMILTGAPTLEAANFFKNSGYFTGASQDIISERIDPLPRITTTTPLRFAFGETVLFDPVVFPKFYTGVALSPTSNVIQAATYFTDVTVPITSIVSPDLRADLSLNFTGTSAFLVGTPLSAGSESYTIRATNSNGISRDLLVPIQVVTDTVAFTAPAVDSCFNFVLSRPVDLSLNGYYTSPITFAATSASGNPLSWSAPALAGTGLSLSATTGNSVSLVGTPSTVVPLQTLRVTATAAVTGASSFRDVSFAILNDVFTFSNIPSLQFIQNKAITPIQVIATTLSGRPVVSYSSSGLPPGITISSTGLISGQTLVDGSTSATITASTGFANSSFSIPITVLTDNIVIVMANTTETVQPLFSGVEFLSLTYSGKEGELSTLSSNRAPYQGISFTTSFISDTQLQGDFARTPVLLPEYRFGITGTAGSLTTATTVRAVATNAPAITRNRIELTALTDPQGGPNPIPQLGTVRILQSTTTPIGFSTLLGLSPSANPLIWNPTYTASNIPYGIHDLAANGSTLVATLGNTLVRSINAGTSWSVVPSSNIEAIDVSGGPVFLSTYYPPSPLFGCIATDGASNWLALASGTGSNGSGPSNTILRQSSDNGVTWIDTSTSTVVSITRNTKLFYSNGRYFVLAGESNVTPLRYANASDVSTWVTPIGFLGTVLRGLATSNSTLIVAGDDTNVSTCFISSDAGTSWAPLSPQPDLGTGLEINTISYAHGTWVIGGSKVGNISVWSSSNLSTWINTLGGVGNATCSVEDGGAWQFGGSGGGNRWLTGLWNLQGDIDWTTDTAFSGPTFGSKRMTSTAVSTGSPTLTLSIPYDAAGISIVAPTESSYLNWQFVPISPITIQATPAQFLYYYVSGLPDGLTFTPNDDGLSGIIRGTSVRFSDAPQRVLLFVALGSNVAPKILTMRTILPRVVLQQTSAGAFTSLVRQYTEVNAATTSRDTRITPVVEYRLGEFTSPQPPDVTSAKICPC
jgi:hypothetical protein